MAYIQYGWFRQSCSWAEAQGYWLEWETSYNYTTGEHKFTGESRLVEMEGRS